MKILLFISLAAISIHGDKLSALQEFRNSNILFASNLYKELLKTNSGNFLVCPFSTEVILALVHAGARGNTAKELANGLHFPDNTAKIQDLVTQLEFEVNNSYTLTSVNKVYLDHKFTINNDFKNIANNVFKADIENVDFSNNVKAASSINHWVETQTQNKIKNLIKESYLTKDTLTVLVNAMYFNANWLYPFDSKYTKRRDFYINRNDKTEVDMMFTEEEMNLFNNEQLGARFLELPYDGEDVTMTIVLPNDIDGLATLETKIADVLVRQTFPDQNEVTIALPKFKMETSFSLKPILENLGVVEAFGRSANFRGMTVNDQDIYLTHVVQKTFIEVTEKGTTAGAATAVIGGNRSFGSSFIANHPFIYILRHKTNGILFVGKYIGP